MRQVLSNRVLMIALVGAAICKILIAHYFPITSDGAYFLFWAGYPDFGYYDHPPMAAWLLSPFLAVADVELWLRLPAILISLGITLGIYFILRRHDQTIATLAAILYAFTPINLVGVLVTTDTPLLLWSFLSGLCFYQGQRQGRAVWYLLCGFFLGLAFLSKFFSGLLAVAYGFTTNNNVMPFVIFY